MNERIKELARQADIHALKTIGNLWIGWEEKNPGWEDCRDQKFAELIVRECIKSTLNLQQPAIAFEWGVEGTIHVIVDTIAEDLGMQHIFRSKE